MNTMFKGQNQNIIQKFLKFRSNLLASGKDPQVMLNELVSSGKYTQEQINNAKNMAEKFAKIIK